MPRALPPTLLAASGWLIAHATGQWWVLALGLIGGVILFFNGATRASETFDDAHRAMAERLLASQANLETQLRDSAVAEHLGLTAKTVERVVRQGLALLTERQALTRALAASNVTQAKDWRAQLDTQARAATNADTAARYREAADAHQAQLEEFERVQSTLQRLDAESAALQAKLDRISASLLRLRSVRTTFDAPSRAHDELRSLVSEVSAVSDAYDRLDAGPSTQHSRKERS